MAEYIDREKALKAIRGQFPDAHYPSWYADIIEEIPAANVFEVERCENISDMHPVDEFICSSCGVIIRECSRYEVDEDTGDESCFEFEYKYCPRCGKRIIYEEAPGNG